MRLLCNFFGVAEASDEEMADLGAGFAPLADKYADNFAGEYFPEILAFGTAVGFAAPRILEYQEKKAAEKKPDTVAREVKSELTETFV